MAEPLGRRGLSLAFLILVGVGLTLNGRATAEDPEQTTWFEDWGIEEGFRISEDSSGFVLPTAIAFVPQPDSNPDDPLYFVAELRGKIKVVTNARDVFEFATVPAFEPSAEYPQAEGEGGLGAICLDPFNGYVFATYTYYDDDGLLRNGITRFDSDPGTFSLKPNGSQDYLSTLAEGLSALSHQIGGCRTVGNELYVGVGDGGNPLASSDPSIPVGKVLRFTLDGAPHPENPFAGEGGAATAAWAIGLRNPFGIELVGSEVYVADNGVLVDRLVHLEAGQDYLWNGSDESIKARADAFFQPSIGPAHMVYVPPGQFGWPEGDEGSFYIAATSVSPDREGIYRLEYDIPEDHALDQPRLFLRPVVDRRPTLAAIALGPDGIYFSPLRPDEGGQSPVLRVSYDPATEHPIRIVRPGGDAEVLIEQYQCLSCHSLGGTGGTVGPSLDRSSLSTRALSRISSPSYRDLVTELDRLQVPPMSERVDERAEVLDATSDSEKLNTWVKYRIIEPKFDDPDAQMPNLGVTPDEAQIIADFLIGRESLFSDALTSIFGSRRGMAVFGAGLVVGSLIALLSSLVVRSLKKRGRRPQRP